MALYSVNTAHIQIYSLHYSIVYSVEYMQCYTPKYIFQQFNNYRFLDRILQVYDIM